jgi:tRNA 5-methylaminomethyl-2-thiouridine biosynthesis bifunctional protein
VIQRQNALWQPLTPPAIERVDGGVRAKAFDDVYFQTDSGEAESIYTFLEGNDLPNRWQAPERSRFYIAETGFGTGLNFLLTWAAFEAALGHQPNELRLHYLGIDAHPLTREQLASTLALFPRLARYANALIKQWPENLCGVHRLCFDEGRITLDLWWEDAQVALADLASHRMRWIDAWYLDGFAPAKNPGLWSPEVLASIAALTRPGGTFATFTAAGDVRRGLQAVGFDCRKRPGFGRKREALQGALGVPDTQPLVQTPWDLPPPHPVPASVLVIGAGLAGAAVAQSLAKRGIAVTVLEQAKIASGGSSNRQGLTYTRLSRRHGSLSDFTLAAYLHATRHYRAAFDQGHLHAPRDGEQRGYVQLSEDDATLDYLTTVLGHQTDWAQVLNSAELSSLIGQRVTKRGIYYRDAAWLWPKAVCEHLLTHPLITVCEGLGALRLRQPSSDSPHWDVYTLNGDIVAMGESAVLACADGTTQLLSDSGLGEHTAYLPLQVIRGQTTHIPEGLALTTAVCSEGYVAPAIDGMHCIGASYGPNDSRLDERLSDHQDNLAKLQRALPEWPVENLSDFVTGHVALRCTSTDYLPLVGPVPDTSAFLAQYRALSQRKTQRIDAPQPTLNNLYLCVGMGSRGLTSALLAGEIIASQIGEEPPPLPRYLVSALAPSRFLYRQIIRGQL